MHIEEIGAVAGLDLAAARLSFLVTRVHVIRDTISAALIIQNFSKSLSINIHELEFGIIILVRRVYHFEDTYNSKNGSSFTILCY